MGTVNAIAGSTREFEGALRRGDCGIRPIDAFSTEGLSGGIGAQGPAIDAQTTEMPQSVRSADRFSQYAGIAASEAVADARLDADFNLGHRAAVILGTGAGGQGSLEAGYRDIFYERKKRLHPLTVLRTMASSAAAQLSIEYGVTGPCFSVNTACAAGAHAIGLAAQMIRSGQIDTAIAGGSEAPLTWGHLKAWEAMRLLSPDGCRPFAKNRKGLVLGEGAGVLVLEAADQAESRGASSHAELLGFSMTADATDMINPSVDRIAATMEEALREAELEPGSIDHINAHGTGTHGNDIAETKAIRAVFGSAANGVSISSTKAMHGHCLGASGAIEAIAAIIAMKHQFVPPTIGLDEPDPECDLDYTANVARERDVGFAMSNSFAFGGMNAVLIFGRA